MLDTRRDSVLRHPVAGVRNLHERPECRDTRGWVSAGTAVQVARPIARPCPFEPDARLIRIRLVASIVVASMAAASGGCRGEHPEAARTISPVAQADTVLRSRLFLTHPRLANATSISIVGDFLVAVGLHGSWIDVYRMTDRRLVRTLGPSDLSSGPAPAIWSVQRSADSNDELWAYDLGTRRLELIALTGEALQSRVLRTVVVKTTATLTGPVWVNESTFVSPGFFDHGRLGVFDAEGKLRRVVGSDPEGDSSTPVAVRQHAYQLSSCWNRERSLLGLATLYADELLIVSANGDIVARVRGGWGIDPVFGTVVRHGRPVLVSGPSMRLGYLRMACSSNAIFALFSGKSRQEAGARATVSRLVHVFDWQGRLVEVLHLDVDLRAIAIDTKGDVLYALTAGDSVVRYAIPQLPTDQVVVGKMRQRSTYGRLGGGEGAQLR